MNYHRSFIFLTLSVALGLTNSSYAGKEILIDLEASRTLQEKRKRGGGFDNVKSYSSHFFAPDLKECVKAVESATEEWRLEQNGIYVLEERGLQRVRFHIQKPDIPGFFEIFYRFKQQDDSAHLTFLHYTPSGGAINPRSDPRSNVDKLVPKLRKALLCS